MRLTWVAAEMLKCFHNSAWAGSDLNANANVASVTNVSTYVMLSNMVCIWCLQCRIVSACKLKNIYITLTHLVANLVSCRINVSTCQELRKNIIHTFNLYRINCLREPWFLSMWDLLSQACSLIHFVYHLVKMQSLFCYWVGVGGAEWDVTFHCGLTSLLTEVFHSVPAVAAWTDIIREGAVDKGECFGYWPVMSVEMR